LKIVVAVVVLFGAFAAQPGIAKEIRAHHAATTEKHPNSGATAGSTAGGPAAGKGVNSVSTPAGRSAPSDATGAAVTSLSPGTANAADKARNPGIDLKVVKPTNSQAHDLSAPTGPVVRNSIGEIVARPQNATAGEEHFGATAQTPIGRSGGAAQAIGGSTINRQNPHPVTTASSAGGGKIDGMIRPISASTLGGPAKTPSGINGTMLRPKY
jgi:hypothetical protein